jgi:pSer/pThr/pTyr-binding forkhead associated (FHA) protein
MTSLDFPTWFGIGSYGGLAADLLCATALVAFAQWSHRGSPRTLARTILVCLLASSLMLAAIWWNQNRLDLYGPSLPSGEVSFWLFWTALLGWGVPITMLAGYIALAAAPTAAPVAVGRGSEAFEISSADRRVEPLGAGHAWGRLIPMDGPFAEQALSLTRTLTVVGREIDNDLVLDDELSSRRHAEIRWENGRAQVRDLDSLNGTFVNGQSARGRLPLRSGDVLQFGARSYRVELLTSGGLQLRPAIAPEGETSKVPGVGAGRSRVVPFVLVGVSAPVEAYRWQLDQSLTSIGRDPASTVALPDESVSRVHAQIVRQQAGLYLSDLNSSNGTRLNGAVITAPTPLSHGDRLQFGEVALQCELPASAAQPTIPLGQELRAAVTSATSATWEASSEASSPPEPPPGGDQDASMALAPAGKDETDPSSVRSTDDVLAPTTYESDCSRP